MDLKAQYYQQVNFLQFNLQIQHILYENISSLFQGNKLTSWSYDSYRNTKDLGLPKEIWKKKKWVTVFMITDFKTGGMFWIFFPFKTHILEI